MGSIDAPGFRTHTKELETCEQVGRPPVIALLVRGEDEQGHFEFVEPPEHPTSPEGSSIPAKALWIRAADTLPKAAEMNGSRRIA